MNNDFKYIPAHSIDTKSNYAGGNYYGNTHLPTGMSPTMIASRNERLINSVGMSVYISQLKENESSTVQKLISEKLKINPDWKPSFKEYNDLVSQSNLKDGSNNRSDDFYGFANLSKDYVPNWIEAMKPEKDKVLYPEEPKTKE